VKNILKLSSVIISDAQIRHVLHFLIQIYTVLQATYSM